MFNLWNHVQFSCNAGSRAKLTH